MTIVGKDRKPEHGKKDFKAAKKRIMKKDPKPTPSERARLDTKLVHLYLRPGDLANLSLASAQAARALKADVGEGKAPMPETATLEAERLIKLHGDLDRAIAILDESKRGPRWIKLTIFLE